MKIADIHAHIFPEKLAEKASHSIGSFYGVSIEREADMPRLCAEDKLAGITRCVVSNSATNASQVQNANTFLAEAVRGHDGYLAFGTIYPGMDGFEEELDRMLELGLRGIKIHPDFQKLAIVLGTEGDGLAHSTIAACDYTVKIPMSHGVDSLNVAAASAVAFWQLGNR